MRPVRSAWGTVEFVDSVTSATRNQLSLFWYPMLVFGVLSLIAGFVAFLGGVTAAGVVWFIGGPIGSIATTVHYQRSTESIGLRTDATPSFVIVALLALGTFTLPFVVGGDPAWAISLWTGTCYLGFAWLERSRAVAAVAATFLSLGLAFIAVSVPVEFGWFSLISGAALLVGGTHARPRRVIQ